MWQNECASSGCNYPEGECLGVCMHKKHSDIPDLVAMWNAIPEAERKELTKDFAQAFNEQARSE